MPWRRCRTRSPAPSAPPPRSPPGTLPSTWRRSRTNASTTPPRTAATSRSPRKCCGGTAASGSTTNPSSSRAAAIDRRAETVMPADQRAVIVKLLREASVEVSGHDVTVAGKLSPWLRPGADVYVNFVPGHSYRQSAEVAAVVRRAGFTPIPHVAARSMRDRAELSDFLKRLSGEAAVERVLVIGGDVLKPVGFYASSLDVIRTGLLQENGIRSVAVAGHPEGH